MKVSSEQLKQLIKEELNKELQINESIYDEVATTAALHDKASPEEQLAAVWVVLKHMAKTLETVLHEHEEMSKRLKGAKDDPIGDVLDQMGVAPKEEPASQPKKPVDRRLKYRI